MTISMVQHLLSLYEKHKFFQSPVATRALLEHSPAFLMDADPDQKAR